MEVDFPEVAYEEPLEALRMEHFYFPLILWCGGLLLSTIALLAEVIFRHRGAQQ